jgi:hypothetical protein
MQTDGSSIIMSIKNVLKKSSFILSAYYWLEAIGDFFSFSVISFFSNVKWFAGDYFKYKSLQKNNDSLKIKLVLPCLKDKTTNTPLDPIYFYQDTWAARKIFDSKPKHHYDVGSSAKTVGIISQFTPTTMIDIRPIDLKLDNLSFTEGSILNLPFEDNSIESISSICVIEHIGLGRYGDPLDVYGSEKAITELQRVAAPGGIILISVPVDDDNKIYFNANRAFTREYIIGQFSKCKLAEEKYIYGKELTNEYDKSKGFGTGLYMFTKS